jgi:Ca-activated chloride channel family protein
MVFLAGLALAAASPAQKAEVTLTGSDGIDMALALDISATMQAADLEPNRLEVLKDLSKDLVRRTAGNRFAVFAFAKHCFTQTPLSPDAISVSYLIESLDYRSINHAESGGTAIGDALLMAGDALRTNRVAGRDQVVVLVTDGESNSGADPLIGARFLLSEGIRLYVIGVGQDEPVPVYVDGKPFINNEDKHLHTQLDDAQLKEIAGVAEGQYYRADSTDALRAIFEEIAKLERAPLEEEEATIVESRVPDVALGIAILFCLMLGLEGFVLRRPLR